MAEIKISCEHCGQHIQCDESYRGTQINCPQCQQSFQVPAERKIALQSPEQPSNQSVSMPIIMLLVWPILGVVAFFFFALVYEWEINRAVILGFSLRWIVAGVGVVLLGKLLSRLVSSSETYKKLDNEVQKLSPTANISMASDENTNHANLTSAQFAALENSIKTTLNTVVVQNIRLSHRGGSKYKAHLAIMTAQGSEQCVADVNFDGDKFAWQIANEAQKGTAGFRLLGLAIMLLCGWMMFLTYDKYHNGALVTATAKYLSVLHTTDLPSNPEIAQVQQKMDVLQWKASFINSGWLFGFIVGLVQLCTGRNFANLPWLKIIIACGIGFFVGLIQRL